MDAILGFAIFIGWIGATCEIFKRIVDMGITAYMMLACTWVFGSLAILHALTTK